MKENVKRANIPELVSLAGDNKAQIVLNRQTYRQNVNLVLADLQFAWSDDGNSSSSSAPALQNEAVMHILTKVRAGFRQDSTLTRSVNEWYATVLRDGDFKKDVEAMRYNYLIFQLT